MKNLCAFLSVLLVVACASVDSEKPDSVSPNGNAVAKKNEKFAAPSMQEQYDSGRWSSGMQNGDFIIVGVSSRLARQADEIEAAKQDAARKASMYQGIQGSIVSTNTSGSAYFDYSSSSVSDLKYDTNYEQYMERLSYNLEKDVIRGAGGTYIRFKYDISGPDLVYIPEKGTGRPAWTYSRYLPLFPGYAAAMGYAGRKSWIRDTINASCDDAAAQLIGSVSSVVETSTNTQAGQGSSTAIDIRSEGSLTNFHVIDMWINADSGAVYTLAVARISR